MESHVTTLNDKIDALSPGISSCLQEMDAIDGAAAKMVLEVILGYACQATHVAPLLAGRSAMQKIPKTWLCIRLDDAISAKLNLDDEGDFQRLMELLEVCLPEKLPHYVAIGLASNDIGVQEAASDYAN